MIGSNPSPQLDQLAQHMFNVVTRFCLAVPRGKRRSGELKEIEFLALSLLHEHQTMIVGDIQRQLRVLPAQMSRVIRSLEARERPLIICRINPNDKRKIDVCLTPEGTAGIHRISSRLRVQTISIGLARTYFV
jgi:DNA-binding MarR family transcriptional regulator